MIKPTVESKVSSDSESATPIKTFLDKNYPHEQVILPAFIERPELQHWLSRGTFGIFALIGLSLWFYLFVPILSLLAWWFGWYRFDQYIIHDYRQGYTEHMTVLIALVCIMGLLLLGWASYNVLRFYHNERRHATPDIVPQDLAEFYNLNTELVQQAQLERMTIISYDEHGKITEISFSKLESSTHTS